MTLKETLTATCNKCRRQLEIPRGANSSVYLHLEGWWRYDRDKDACNACVQSAFRSSPYFREAPRVAP